MFWPAFASVVLTSKWTYKSIAYHTPEGTELMYTSMYKKYLKELI